MKQQPTVTRLLRRLEEALSKIDRLDSILKERIEQPLQLIFIIRKIGLYIKLSGLTNGIPMELIKKCTIHTLMKLLQGEYIFIHLMSMTRLVRGGNH